MRELVIHVDREHTSIYHSPGGLENGGGGVELACGVGGGPLPTVGSTGSGGAGGVGGGGNRPPCAATTNPSGKGWARAKNL